MTVTLPRDPAGDASLWDHVNRACLAKSLSELSFEEALIPLEESPGLWRFPIREGLWYRAEGERRIWGHLSLDASTLRRVADGVDAPVTDAARFFCDAQALLALSGATLATYLHELRNTLLSDVVVMRRNGPQTAASLLAMPDDRLQAYLGGHPKAPAAKGRLGWGEAEQLAYAPEHGGTFPLQWLAVARADCDASPTADIDDDAVLADMMDPADARALDAGRRAAGATAETHLLMPVHPWQWAHMVQVHYAEAIATGRIVSLGARGAAYRPLISLRTLSHAGRVARWDVKLPLTILNTSAYRGLPPRSVVGAPLLSDWLANQIKHDPVLSTMRLVLLRDVYGITVPHPLLADMPGVPYRFHEMLGAAWRERVDTHLRPGEQAVMAGALNHRAGDGVPLVCALVRQSGLTTDEWLERLFGSVVVPLYHLMCRHGAGFIAHGQNVTVILDQAVPVGVAVKDLHGDFDLLEPPLPEHAGLPEAIRGSVGRRQAGHLIHHLQTGHFISVLRFVSEALASHDGFNERRFYGILAAVLQRYMTSHPELRERFQMFDLFGQHVMRICINRARFRVGYGDDPARPKPDTGTPLVNPLHVAQCPFLNAQTAQEYAP